MEAVELFYLHEFSEAISTSQGSHPEIEALSHLALHNLPAIKGLQHSDQPSLKSIALMAVFQHAPAQRVVALSKLGELAMTGDAISAYLYICALISDRSLVPQALQFLQGAPASELLALRHQLLLLSSLAVAPLAVDHPAIRTTEILENLMIGNFDQVFYAISDLDLPASSLWLLQARVAANLGRGRLAEAADDLRKLQALAPEAEGTLVHAVALAFRGHETQKAFDKLAALKNKFPDNDLVNAWGKCQQVCRNFVVQ